MPNFFDKAVSFSKAIAVQVAAGCPVSSKEEQKARHDICQSCDFFDDVNYKCKSCGCNLLYKIPLATSTCPKGKWENKNG